MSTSSAESSIEFPCRDCGRDILAIDEHYMVTDEVWAASGLGTHDGCLCIGCLEVRLGRTLTPVDFMACPLNLGIFEQSDRLRARLGDPGWMLPIVEAYLAAR